MADLRKIRLQHYQADASAFIGEVGSLFFDQTSTTLRIGDGETAGGNAITGGGASPLVTISYSDIASGSNDAVGTIGDSGISEFEPGSADILYSVTSGSEVSASGVMVFYSGNIITVAGLASDGANGVRINTADDQANFVAIAWASNDAGTAYSAPSSGTSRFPCLALGTMIALADGTYKPIEAITYDDELLVWNFDHGFYAAAKPLWIMQPKPAPAYNVVIFDDGRILHTVGQHRIYNKEAGCFTYPLTDATPVGTASFNEFGREITLVEKFVVEQDTTAFNIVTDYHINLFANGVLTSCRFNNLYPIVDMQFVKEPRDTRQFAAIPERYYDGLRLAEQMLDDDEIERYVARMLRSDSIKTFA